MIAGVTLMSGPRRAARGFPLPSFPRMKSRSAAGVIVVENEPVVVTVDGVPLEFR